MIKMPYREYTGEFKELAVKRLKEGLTTARVSKGWGVSDQTLLNWVKAAAAGELQQCLAVLLI